MTPDECWSIVLYLVLTRAVAGRVWGRGGMVGPVAMYLGSLYIRQTVGVIWGLGITANTM